MARESYRFKLHAQAPAAPGVCFICRSIVDSPVVDTGANEPFIGAIYIGHQCLREMFSLLEEREDFNMTQVLQIRDDVTRLADDEFKRAFAKIGDAINDARTRIELGARSILPDALDPDIFDVEDDNDAEGLESNVVKDSDGDESVVDEVNVEGGNDSVDQGSDELSGNSSDGAGVPTGNSDDDEPLKF